MVEEYFPTVNGGRFERSNSKALGVDPNQVMEIEGVTGTFEEFRAGIETPDGQRVTWIGNKRLGRWKCRKRSGPHRGIFRSTTTNRCWAARISRSQHADGTVEIVPGDNMIGAFVNSLSVAVPATVIPILIAAFAAYAFAWMRFPGRRSMFIMVGCAACGPPADCPGANPEDYRCPAPERYLPGYLAGTYGLRAGPGNIPAVQLHQRPAAGDP